MNKYNQHELAAYLFADPTERCASDAGTGLVCL